MCTTFKIELEAIEGEPSFDHPLHITWQEQHLIGDCSTYNVGVFALGAMQPQHKKLLVDMAAYISMSKRYNPSAYVGYKHKFVLTNSAINFDNEHSPCSMFVDAMVRMGGDEGVVLVKDTEVGGWHGDPFVIKTIEIEKRASTHVPIIEDWSKYRVRAYHRSSNGANKWSDMPKEYLNTYKVINANW